VPAEDERVGYVPNVVYTCGAMLHNDSLIIPYATGGRDHHLCLLQVDELIASLKRE
jgi:Predicted glycosylase